LPTKKSKKITKKVKKDLCPVCDYNLYFNSKYTQRIGVLDGTKDIIGWICPECSSEFDLDNNILYIYGENSTQGMA
tara:strand:+ start:329 stop:556 length:228 start_codon:yes stop_codon:yes gene_type:complete